MNRLKQYLLLFFLALSTFQAAAQDEKVDQMRIPDLETILTNSDDVLHVINFWATWCGPCVREYPLFEKVSRQYKGKKVQFLMVSLDFPSQIESKLIPFLEKNRSSLDVAVMMDVDYNAWIDKVDKSWQGDIPVTLVFNNARKKRSFHAGELNEPQLKELIDSNL